MNEATADQDLVLMKDPRKRIAFPMLSEDQISALESLGTRVKVPAGEIVWKVGDTGLCMYVVIEGSMLIRDGRSHQPIARHMKGGFSGDVDVLSGRPTLVEAMAETDLDLLKVAAECVRNIVGEMPEIGGIILSAFLMRRAILQESSKAGPLVVGSRYSSDTLRIREFLARNRIPHVWEDLESNPATSDTLREFQVSEDQTPIVVLPTGKLLKTPGNRELAEALGIIRPVESKFYDLIIVGAGPAGLAAAVYGASEGLSTLMVDAVGPGGQAGTSSRIENYMGFPAGLSGQDLADRGVVQAERFGAEMVVPGSVMSISCGEFGSHEVDVDGLGRLDSKCVILAPGARYRELDVPEFERFVGRGVYHSATHVERILCGGSEVAVVGAGNSAGQAAVFLADQTKHVFLVVRGDDLRKTMSSYLALRIERSSKISVLLNSEVCALQGQDHLESIAVVDRRSGSAQTIAVKGVFVMIGAVPCTDWLPESIVRDPKGFVLTGLQLLQEDKWKSERPPFLLETSCPGVFAAGDVRAGSIKRVASAVGEGSMAVAFVHQYLAL